MGFRREADVDLTATYNTLAGKVISNAELRLKLKEAGINPDKTTLTRKEQKRKQRHLQGFPMGPAVLEAALQAGFASSLYITSVALAKIEEGVLHRGNPGGWNPYNTKQDYFARVLGEEVERNKGETYAIASPTLVQVALAFDNKLVKAYAKALEDCADYRAKVGTDLQPLVPAVVQLEKKMAPRFGLMP